MHVYAYVFSSVAYRKFSLPVFFFSLLTLFHCQVRIQTQVIICNRYLNFRNSSFHSRDCFLDPFGKYTTQAIEPCAVRTHFSSRYLKRYTLREPTMKMKKKKELFRHRYNSNCNGKFIGSAFEVNRILIFFNNLKVCCFLCFKSLSFWLLLCLMLLLLHALYTMYHSESNQPTWAAKKRKTIWI